MSLQYITDSNGQTTGVYIPIREWDELKSRLGDLEQPNIPEWHKETVRERMELYRADPSKAMDFDEAMDDIEKQL